MIAVADEHKAGTGAYTAAAGSGECFPAFGLDRNAVGDGGTVEDNSVGSVAFCCRSKYRTLSSGSQIAAATGAD
jgi:hypothetical protein